MPIKKITFMSAALCFMYLAWLPILHKEKTIGLTTLYFTDTTRNFENKPRIINVLIWYPVSSTIQTKIISHPIWKIKDVAENAPILSNNKKLPLVLFSHGYGGDAFSNSWFPEYLASYGYIVASIEHYGNTYNNKILEISARPWNRPEDISFVLDQLLTHSIFKNYIDKNRIGAAGFSQGGMTSLWVGGAIAYITEQALQKHVNTIIDDPEWKNINKNFTQEDIHKANQLYRDTRIKAIFAMSPGIDKDNWMFSDSGLLKDIDIPVHIIAGEADDTIPITENAQFFADHISQSTLTILPGKVTHWTFMNEGTEQGKKIVPYITTDDSSINRATIHEHVGAIALMFFNKYL
jgi:predicted dienelactone hydrolase